LSKPSVHGIVNEFSQFYKGGLFLGVMFYTIQRDCCRIHRFSLYFLGVDQIDSLYDFGRDLGAGFGGGVGEGKEVRFLQRI